MVAIVQQNAIHSLVLYRHGTDWVFDDKERGIVKEPLVAGIDLVLDTLTADMPGAKAGVQVRFAADPFPGAQIQLQRVAEAPEKKDGTWYYCPQLNEVGWLCAVLYCYFETAPVTIHVQLSPITHPWWKRLWAWATL